MLGNKISMLVRSHETYVPGYESSRIWKFHKSGPFRILYKKSVN